MPRRRKKKTSRRGRERQPPELEAELKLATAEVAGLVDGVNEIRQLSLRVALAALALCGVTVLRLALTSHVQIGELFVTIFFGLLLSFSSFYVTFYFGCRRRVPELESLIVGTRGEFEPHHLIVTTTYAETGDRQLDMSIRTYVTARARLVINVLIVAVLLPVLFLFLLAACLTS
jgi:hypothetical protein